MEAGQSDSGFPFGFSVTAHPRNILQNGSEALETQEGGQGILEVIGPGKSRIAFQRLLSGIPGTVVISFKSDHQERTGVKVPKQRGLEGWSQAGARGTRTYERTGHGHWLA